MPILDEPIVVPEAVEGFRLEDHAERFRIVGLGDSVTQSVRWPHPQRWTTILETLLGPECVVVNSGIGGTSSSLGLFRWHRDVAPIKSHCVVICFLLNDSHIRHYECRSSYVVQMLPDRMDANLRLMVEMTRAMGATPVFWTPPPVPAWPDAFKSPTHMEIQLRLLDHYLHSVEQAARDLEVPVANYWRTFPTLVEEFPGPYFNRPDVYHSNDRSQPVIAAGLAELVRPILERWKAGAAVAGAR